MTIDLDKLRFDGDVIELEDGRQLRLKVVPDEDTSIFDEPFWGEFQWVRGDSDYAPARSRRPDEFDGNAEIIAKDHGSCLWWQPPRGDYALSHGRGTPEFAEFRQSVKDLLEYGFCGVMLELLDGVDAYQRPIVVEVESTWGIDSLNNGEYLAEIVKELAGELDIEL